MMLVTTILLLANTYTDEKAGLIWQDDVAAENVKGYWDDALEYCDNLRLNDKRDWRLPTVRELYSLIDLNADAWLVYFEDGVVNHYSKTRKRHIRCVRDIKEKTK